MLCILYPSMALSNIGILLGPKQPNVKLHRLMSMRNIIMTKKAGFEF